MRIRNPNPKRTPTEEQFVVAVHITGTPSVKNAATDQATLAKDLVAIVGDKEKIGYFPLTQYHKRHNLASIFLESFLQFVHYS